ncbi:MAG: SUMF1/EgtB/PvdO family nonheme iron enzyme [Verrucomicrobia bacterium]|nr:SUMF1/EgtB/PvdO family nonheme iron enzyme [Verrucomicrobiota bacterium]
MTRQSLARRLRSLGCALSAVLQLDSASAASVQALPYLFESDATGPPNRLLWQTEPGVRYDLWKSDNLATWCHVSGYPAVAVGLAMEHAFTPGPRGFFQIVPLDEQPPVVVGQYPAADGFAVGRFATVSIDLGDASGIDPSSVRLTVGTTGPLAPGVPGLTISGNTVTYHSGDVALGAWGATVTATLVVADTLGNTLTHTWSFRLEPEPQVAANIFVFGSPTAQRAGQRVSGPAAALAARYPIPPGPVKADAPPPWSIESVMSDRIIIAYEAGGMPAFTAGQLICNLTPTKWSEIFYRCVLSTSNDSANLRLTVMTEDAPLTRFFQRGAIALSSGSVVYETSPDGILLRVLNIDLTTTFPRLGRDLSGASIRLTGSGSEASIPGLPPQIKGGGDVWASATADEWFWWLTPTVRAAMEIENWQLKSFECVAKGQVSTACAISVAAGGGFAIKGTVFEAPSVLNYPVLLAVILIPVPPFGIPVYATAGFGFALEASGEIEGGVTTSCAYRQESAAEFGLSYNATSGVDWIRSFQAEAPDIVPPSLALEGELGFKFTLVPKLNLLVYGLAGAKVAIEPSVGFGVFATTQGSYGGQFEADLDCVIGTDGPAFELLGLNPELSFTIWHGTWPLFGNGLVFRDQPLSQTVAPGDNVSFACAVDSPSPPSFQWFQNGLPIFHQTTRSLFLQRVDTGYAGNYFVRAKAGNLTVDSNTATLTVQTVTPANKDSDSDGIPDIYETGTGVWVSATNTGTDPYKWDSDGDGLSDGVETNTGVYVSRSSTGTDPNKADTDGDGVNDKREIDIGTNPNALPTRIIGLSGSLAFGTVNLNSVAHQTLTISNTGDVPLHVTDIHPPPGFTATPTVLDIPPLGGKKEIDITFAPTSVQSYGGTITVLSNKTSGENTIACSGTGVQPVPEGFALISAGQFDMGCSAYNRSEIPVHVVNVSTFFMAKYEVTKELWDDVWAWGMTHGYTDLAVGCMDGTRNCSKGPTHPVYRITWYDMVKWCNARSEMEGLTPCYTLSGAVYQTTNNDAVVCNWNANGYRLPTEAEWEKAARGGLSGQRYPWGDTISHSQANYYSMSNYSYDVSPTRGYHPTYAVGYAAFTSPVGSFAPEPNYGLCDMTGNVAEWCWDWLGLYDSASQTDPRGAASGTHRVVRGGFWGQNAAFVRVASRADNPGYPSLNEQYYGFRLARSSVP